MGLVLVEASPRDVKYKTSSKSQHRFTKGKLCLNNLIAFYDYMTGSVEKGREIYNMILFLVFIWKCAMLLQTHFPSEPNLYGNI